MFAGDVARFALQVFAHLARLLKQLLGITHHLRVAAQHYVAAVGIER